MIEGGPGDDILTGGSGNDELRGGPGTDTAAGGSGTDVCAAESTTSCENIVPDQGEDQEPPAVAVLSPADGDLVGESVVIEIAADDDTGVVAVDLIIDSEVTDSVAEPDPDGIYRFGWTFTASGDHLISARAHDGAANTTESAAVTVTVPAEALPSSYVVFSGPVDLADLVPVLQAAGLEPLEFEHVVTQSDGQTTGGGFYAADVPLSDQEAYYRAFHQDAHGTDPAVITVRVSGNHEAADLGDLEDEVESVESVPGLAGDGTATAQGIAGSSSVSNQQSSEEEREDWWPDRGTLYAFDSEVTFLLPPPCTLLCPPVSLVLPTRTIRQEFEWLDQEAVDLLTAGVAYEHDFKLLNDSLDSGTDRPFCGFSSDDFWASRIVRWWDTTIPFLARPYLDTGVLDSCTQSDFTIGVLLPNVLNAELYETTIESLHGDLSQSPYLLEAQRLGKLGGALAPSKWFVNVPGVTFGPETRELIGTLRPDGSERTVPTFCTGWRVLETTTNPEPIPFIDEHACET